MVLYELMDCVSEEEYTYYFYDTLMLSNTTADYFVDWVKVFKDISEYKSEIKLLNEVAYDDFPEDRFKSIIRENKNLINFLNKLIALREDSIEIYDKDEMSFTKVNFNNESELNNLVDFFRKIEFFDKLKEIEDIYSYLVGIEVGLNSHARKNRGGIIFESIIKEIIEDLIKFDPTLEYEYGKISLLENRKFNNVIYKNGKIKFVIQCNFYNNTGGKTKDVIQTCIDSQNQFLEDDIIFIWVTDGPGWSKVKKLFTYASENLNIIVNRQILIDNFENIFSI